MTSLATVWHPLRRGNGLVFIREELSIKLKGVLIPLLGGVALELATKTGWLFSKTKTRRQAFFSSWKVSSLAEACKAEQPLILPLKKFADNGR